ncbi:hypothetical protein Mal15_00380 [Stieleria maiorica]|uniref:Uncharacterized protein n=1 Tax=Stieleria maiorica TaxID=2795974 RepID=A0A5B9M4N6_9BACT|nr:hypothetical protein Mal15_00380 [Stieleria maiorica]
MTTRETLDAWPVPGFIAFAPVTSSLFFCAPVPIVHLSRATREPIMNYPLLPADAAEHVWQLSCCFITLLFAMFSWMLGPR